MSDHHEYEEVHLHDEHDAEDIELVGNRNNGGSRQRRSAPPPTSSSSGGGGSSTTMWLIILFLIGLVGVYKLGMEEGKAEVQHETHNVGKAGGNNQQAPTAAHDETSTAATTAATTTTTTTTSSTKPPMKFTMSQLTAMRTECHKLIELLDNYYFGKHQATQMLMAPYIDPWNFDNFDLDEITDNPSPTIISKSDATNLRANKLVDTMLRALVTDSQTSFLMGGIGSSVMAGHDNCHYDSYESQMERTFGPVWKAADMEFIFQNAGEGGGCGDSYENQIYCVRDILHYEWTYFEHGGAYKEHESLIRWVQMLPKQPPLQIFNTGENAKNGQDVQLVQYYAQYGFNAFYMKTGLYNGGYDYDTERKEQDIDRFSWGYIGDGYHNTTRYGEIEVDDARRDSLGTVVSF